MHGGTARFTLSRARWASADDAPLPLPAASFASSRAKAYLRKEVGGWLCICLSGADGEAGRVSGALKLVVGSVPRPQVARCRGTKRVLWIEDLGGAWPMAFRWDALRGIRHG